VNPRAVLRPALIKEKVGDAGTKELIEPETRLQRFAKQN
jgi:hypothetical protein